MENTMKMYITADEVAELVGKKEVIYQLVEEL